MSAIIPDETLNACGMTEAEFKLEIAVMLFQADKLTLGQASTLAEVNKGRFQEVLKERNIPLYTYEVEDFELDLKNLRKLSEAS